MRRRSASANGSAGDLVDKGECDKAAGWLADEIVAVIAEAAR